MPPQNGMAALQALPRRAPAPWAEQGQEEHGETGSAGGRAGRGQVTGDSHRDYATASGEGDGEEKAQLRKGWALKGWDVEFPVGEGTRSGSLDWGVCKHRTQPSGRHCSWLSQLLPPRHSTESGAVSTLHQSSQAPQQPGPARWPQWEPMRWKHELHREALEGGWGRWRLSCQILLLPLAAHLTGNPDEMTDTLQPSCNHEGKKPEGRSHMLKISRKLQKPGARHPEATGPASGSLALGFPLLRIIKMALVQPLRAGFYRREQWGTVGAAEGSYLGLATVILSGKIHLTDVASAGDRMMRNGILTVPKCLPTRH